ncbi:MAG: UvrD-helicase domain-containing protein [Paludibacteraceae bacterium]|nr:UvrD-helicase domain-containing protein [Paludibacteraceae bacterium]
MEEILSQLNDNQKDAVLYNDGPSLVVAGAGSGKTRVLTYKIAGLLKSGYEPNRILALTFTNKAADEMKSRIDSIVGDGVSRRLWMGTFHSIFARILRQQAEKIGYKPSFTIYDTADSKSLVKNIVKEMGLDEKKYTPKAVLSRISQLKNSLITPDVYRNHADWQKNDAYAKIPRLSEIYSLYFARCYKACAMDFDDILLYTNILFRDFPEVLAQYQEAFQFILVDEYQDTNFAQHLVVKKLAAIHHHVCVVGDDAQSIYSFRGANIDNILKFREVFPNCKVFKLERNYRSTPNIVKVANSLIAKNKKQLQKNVYSEQKEGSKVKVVCTYSDLDEATSVVSQISGFVSSGKYAYKDMAVLYRTNSQSRVFEEALRKRAIPYVIHGGHSFYQRKEIKDVLSYFRLILNHEDEEAFRRIINYPARGIGDTTMAKVSEVALRFGISYWAVISDPLGYNLPVNAGTATKLTNFRTLIQGLSEDMETTDAYSFTKKVLAESGIRRALEEDKTTEGIGKLENQDELLNSIHEFCESSREETGQDATISDFLQKVSLMSDIDDGGVDVEDKVTLMTVHAAKGLEFKNVFVVGLEEELFPSDMSLKSEDGVEEERRLFYVAITRAEENCIISYAKSRFRNGITNDTLPSRFLKDIDENLLDCPAGFLNRSESRGRYSMWDDEDDFAFSNRGGSSPFSKPWRKTYQPDPEPMPRSTTYVAPRNLKPLASVSSVGRMSDVQPEPMTKAGDIEVGCWVEHEKFGRGTVLSIEGVGGDTKLTINFQNEGERKILLKFARLKNLGK